MLVLTRKSEEKIIIGDDNEENEIVITVLKIQGDKVSLGIKANPKTRVYREELLKSSKGANAQTGKKNPPINKMVKDLQIDLGPELDSKAPIEKLEGNQTLNTDIVPVA